MSDLKLGAAKRTHSLFPNIHGRGEELQQLIRDILDPSKPHITVDALREGWPPYVHDMVFNNFIAPALGGPDVKVSTEEVKAVFNAKDLFLASIL